MGSKDTTGKANVYIEDNHIYGGSAQFIDADGGSRVVYRNNTADFSSFNSHGLATSAIGVRHWEIYSNTFRTASTGESLEQSIANVNWLIWIRGGTGVIFNNAMDNIAGNYWGDKPEARFDIRAQQDNSGTNYGDYSDGRAWLSAGKGAYPRQHQLAMNWSSKVQTNGGYFIEPIYIWGNTGPGTLNGGLRRLGIGDAWGNQDGYFASGRDYYNGGSGKPGYTPYTYPHPLAAATTTQDTTLDPPSNLRVIP
jgi:hypothetical protein